MDLHVHHRAHLAVVAVILFHAVATTLAQSECDANRRPSATGMSACLNKIKSDVSDKDLFWFGTKFTTLCPMGPISLGCFNGNYPAVDSLESRLFPSGINTNLIEKYLEVQYSSEQGTYSACGYQHQGDAWQGEIIPTSGDVYKPWTIREAPTLTWDANDNEIYTVIFYDAGSYVIHWVAVNIPGNDVSSGEVIKVYNGPKVSFDRDNVYAFFLYRQPGRITVSPETAQLIASAAMGRDAFSIPGFANDHGLTGPVAVNWLLATGDVYAAGYMNDFRIFNNCPIFVGKELDRKARPILPNPAHLTADVTVRFDNTPIQYTVCCKTTMLGSRTFAADPYDRTGVVNTALVRTDNSPNVSFLKNGFYPMNTNFTGDMYTLMVVDTDVPFPTFGTESRPILHMMVVNIIDGDVNTGDVVQPYMGPSPPDPNNPHYYYFLLYKQEAEVNANVMPSYSGDCSGLVGRCLYDVNTVVSEQQLTLVGANWMRAQYDDYVILRRLNTSDSAAVNAACNGRPEYEDPCPPAISECDANRRTSATGLTACLNKIKSDVVNKDAFWFGTKYATDCPFGPISLPCFNENFPAADSLESRLFPTGIDTSLIEKYLEVQYSSEQGTYSACGYQHQGGAWQGEIIPTSGDVYTPWVIRKAPTLTWDANDNEMYSVIFYDAGSYVIHWVAVNIPGNSLSSGEVIKTYNGPKVSFDRDNVYAFFLYRQPGRITVSPATAQLIASAAMGRDTFSIPGFATDYGLTGPVGVNWLLATGDVYAAGFMLDARVMNNCPIFVGKELDRKARPILPSPTQLSVDVFVRFDNTPIQYTVCCKTTTLESQTFAANPYDITGVVNTALVRTDNSPNVSFRKSGFYTITSNFTGDMYTLMVVDTDVPFPTAGTESRPILHMMVVNIIDGDVNTGDVVQPYMGPSPPDPNNPHYYYFLLYKQEVVVNANVMTSYAGDCSGSLVGRCLYDVNTAVSDQKLTLVGANWMRAQYDDYVILRRLDTSDSAAVNIACYGRPEYEDPCPTETSGAAMPLLSLCVLISGTFVVKLL